MPQIKLEHACIVDVLPDEQPKGGGQNRTIVINIDEEDLFEMLDRLNRKNIIKYMMMRQIPFADDATTRHLSDILDKTREIERTIVEIAKSQQ